MPIRETHCIRGHKYTLSNLFKRVDGRKMCRACQAARERAKYRNDKAYRLAKLQAMAAYRQGAAE